MNRTLAATVLALCALVRPSGLAQTRPPSEFPSDVDAVTVDVVVLDERQRPVEGLHREDFIVLEDGDPQAIASFDAVVVPESAPTSTTTRSRVSTNNRLSPVGRSFVIVFDDANLSPASAPHARTAIATFFRQGLRTGDQVMVVPTSGGAWWSGRIPEDRDSLLAYMQQLQGKFRPSTGPDHIWDHEALAISMERDPKMIAYVARRFFENNIIPEAYPTGPEARELNVSPGLAFIRAKALETYRAATSRLRSTLETLTRIADSLATVRGRKNLLLVSEGFIMDPSQPEFRELVQAARRSNTAVHYLDARATSGALGQAGMPGAGAEAGRAVEEQDATTVLAIAAQATEGARSVALDTGGSIVPATAGLGQAMSRIADQSRAYYLLGYTPANARRDGKFRKIEVKVRRPGKYQVLARRGYYAPRDAETRKEAPDRLEPRVRAALDAPFAATQLPLRLTAYTVGAATGGKLPVLLLGEADVAALDLPATNGAISAVLETWVVVEDREGSGVQRDEKLLELNVPESRWEEVRRSGVPIRREFVLAPGVYQARLVVRDRASGRLGSVRHEFEVSDAAGLRTSTPILTDVFQRASASEPPRPVPIARRIFPAGSRMAVAYEVYGAATDPVTKRPTLSASYEVKSAAGVVVTSGPPRPLQGTTERVSQVVVFAAPQTPGDYEVVLNVVDQATGTKLETVEPFVVTAGAGD